MTHPARTRGRPPGGRGPLAAPPEELPGDPGSPWRDVLAFVEEHRARLGRLGLHLLVAALPLLAISAHVVRLAPMNVTAGLVVVPAALVVLLLAVFAPVPEDRIVLTGAVWGVIATLVYDAVRLDTVYLLGWWGDFIPTVGTWILGAQGGAGAVGAVVGYVWRYVGDGGGIGVVFFVLVAATGLRRWGERATVAAAVVFAVFPVWTGLVATVAVAPRGEQLMFPLTVATVTLSLLGHLVFGLVLGLGAARCRGLEERWPWPPLLDRPWAGVAAGPPSSTRSSSRSGSRRGRAARSAAWSVPVSASWSAPVSASWSASGPASWSASRAARAVDDRRLGRGDDHGWGPPPPVAGSPARTPLPEAPGEITEIRVDRPVPRRPGRRSGTARRPPSGPVSVGPDSGPIPVPREPVSGPVRVVGTPYRPVPAPGAVVPGPGPAPGPVSPPGPGSAWGSGTGPWSRALPPDGADPWLGPPASTSSAKAHPASAARG